MSCELAHIPGALLEGLPYLRFLPAEAEYGGQGCFGHVLSLVRDEYFVNRNSEKVLVCRAFSV